jgi:hypothetical protein
MPRTLNGATTARAANAKAQTVDVLIVDVAGGICAILTSGTRRHGDGSRPPAVQAIQFRLPFCRSSKFNVQFN